MRWSRSAALAGLALTLLAGACSDETSTVVRVEMAFAEGQNPLEGVESLRVRIVPVDGSDEIRQEIAKPSSGWSGLDEGLALGQVAIESAVVAVEGLDAEGEVVSAGETIPVPVTTGASGRVAVFVQRLGTSGLAPALEQPLSGQGAAYLEGGGVLLAGGAEGADASRAWVYAIDVYLPVQVATLSPSRNLSELVSLGDTALILGGAGAESPPLVFDPTAPNSSAWGPMSRSELADGAWPSPLVDALPGAEGALAVRDRATVLRFDAETAGVAKIAPEPELPCDVAGATLTVLPTEELAVLVGPDCVAAFDSGSGAIVDEIAPPPRGGRAGHAAAALSDGRLVLAGGDDAGGALVEDVEVYDRGAGTWAVYEGLLAGQGRRGARLTRFLADDRLLLSGGESDEGAPMPDAVVIDLSAEGGSAFAIPLQVPRVHHTATALPTGTILLAGGEDASGEPLSSVELVRPPLAR